MARSLNFVLSGASEGQQLSFEIGAKVDKKALYGYAKRISEKDGQVLSRGVLLADGRLLPSNALSWIKVDPEGSPVDPVETTVDGEPAELKPSSFEIDSSLEPVPMARLAEFQVNDVYPLQGSGLADGLYRTEFNYRKSHQPKDALLLVRGDSIFMLVGALKRSTFVDLSVAYDFFDAESESDDADELDFSMI
ncbi:MAG: hypothetical protein KDI71_09015 [Xanthomonadales bacterium]|nr:hypothetical protein [Xanthomonadales bacterium]